MPMQQVGRKTYKSMQGKSIDMDLLRQKMNLLRQWVMQK